MGLYHIGLMFKLFYPSPGLWFENYNTITATSPDAREYAVRVSWNFSLTLYQSLEIDTVVFKYPLTVTITIIIFK
jgi:hypothetical protein